MVSLTEVENTLPYNKDEIDSPVKYLTLADAERTRPMHFDYKRGTLERFQSGIISGIEAIKDIPQQIEIFGNEVSYTLSGFGGDKEEINRKKSNLDTAIRNLEEVQKERDRYSSRAEQESLAFGVGAGVPSYAIALAGGYVGGSVAAALGAAEKGITTAATATGLVSMAPQQFGSEVQQKLPRTEEGEIDYRKMTPEWALKAEGGAVVATAVNLVLEKKLGFGEQIKVWRMPIKFGKSTTTNIVRGLAKGGVTAVSEGMTEGLQDLASYGVSLIDGTANISELPQQLQQSLKSAIIGGILGGTVGTSVAIHEGYNFRKQMRDMIAPVVQDVKKAEQIADEIYNSANDTMTNVISKELELDSQLKAKRGNVYNSMLKAASQAIDKSGGYTGLTEEQKAQHATEVANMFADQVLVEANKRGVVIEDVISAKDIVYQNGEIRLAEKGKSGKELEQSGDLFKVNDEVTGIYGDEFYKKMTLYSGDEQLGYIEYSVVDDEPYIQMIQVPENQRRKGYATELVKRLQREYPNKEINFGMMTREGSKLYKSLPKRIEVNPEYDAMKKKLQDSNKKLKKYEKILNQVTGEETGKEQERIIKAADGWQEEHSKNQEYRDWLENNKREKVFIDTGELFQEETIKPVTNRDNPTRIKQRTLENLLPEEKDAFDRFMESRSDRERILNNLQKNKYDDKGNLTGYYRTAVEDIFIQQAIMDYVNGREVNYESAIDAKTTGGSISRIKSILQDNKFKAKKTIEEKIEYLADEYIGENVLAHPEKCVNAVNSSLLNCNPSRDCAIFCYATHGNYRFPYNLPKSEVIDIVAKYHPKKLARMIATEYKRTNEYLMGKALRLFDKGDGNDYWVEIAKELNNQGVRAAIFTKKPDFMRKINELKTKDGKEINLTMLSIDSSNEQLARDNKDLNVAYVYQGEKNLEFVKDLQDNNRLSVVLPVKLDNKKMSKAEVDRLKEKGIQTKKICPIDAGWLKISKKNVVNDGKLEPAKVGFWNCALCDRMGGVGCYFGRTTEQIISYLQEVGKNDLKLKEKDVNIIINGFQEILQKQKITEGLTNEQLKQFGISEQDIKERIRLLSPTMGESNARAFAGYSLLLSWFGQRHTDVQRAAQDKATKTGILPSEDRAVTYNNEPSQEIYGRSKAEERESADTKRISSDISEDSGRSELEQRVSSIKRGSFNEKSKVIKLFKDANTSTLPHELAHYWLDNMFSYVKSGAASDNYLNQFQAVKDYLGIRDNQEFLTRQQQEKFASGYEKYIHRGIIPNSIMGNVYDGYERWLRDVYDSIEDIKAQGKLPFKLTPEIIKFFDSMLTGGLGEVASQEIADTARLEEMKKADDEVVKDSKQVVNAKPIRPTTELLPVKSDGEERKSRLYERMKDLGDAEDSLGYNEVTIEEQREKAEKLWKDNPEKAQSILDDVNFSNDVLRNAVYTEQQRLALENGDSDTFLSSLRKQSAEATRMGQELSALRGVFDDITMPSYWIRQAENEAHKQLALKMTSYIDRITGKTSLESLTKQLDDDIKSLTKNMLASEDKVKTLSEGIKELKEKYKGLNQKDVELYQEEFTNEEEARKYVEKKAKEAIGLYLTDEQANNIIQMASNLDKMSGKFDKFGVPSEKFFAEKAKLEKAVNEHTPTSQVKVLVSTIGRANMLTAPATSVLNVVSNLENYAIQKMLRYINNNITNHTNNNIVDSDLAEEYRKKLWSTFWNTGYDASTMRSLTDTKLYKGESVTHSEGDGAIREIGRFAEKYVFSRLISSPDVYFKSMRGFTDYIGNEATDIAYKEGLTSEKAKKRANELFLDATRIEPQTEEGKLIRQKAQTEAAVITYQQDTELSKNLLKLRDLINKGTGDIGIGDILSPFVKTPANILSMGYDATVGAFGHPKNLIQALNDLRTGNLQSDALQTAIRQTTNQVLAGVLISMILSTLIDDDDYIPDYSQLSQRERNAVREAGGTFGSVKIGNTYISTDFFGPLEMPLVAWLNARRAKGLTEKASAFGGAVIREFLDAPVIRDTISSSKSLENIGSGHLELEEALYNYLGDTISSRLTPNLLNVLAKITDDYERKAGKSITDKLMARIPVLREQLPAQVSMATGKPIETQSAWLQILFGARAKEERNSPLAKEFMRLSKTGNGASITDPTRYGDLRTLPDDMKPKVLQDFSMMYSKEANRIIKLASYKKASDDDKKGMLDKARRKVTKDIKQKYKKYLKKKKQ